MVSTKFQLAAACTRNTIYRPFRLGLYIEVSASSIYLYSFLRIQEHISITNAPAQNATWAGQATKGNLIQNYTWHYKALFKTNNVSYIQLCKATIPLNSNTADMSVCKSF